MNDTQSDKFRMYRSVQLIWKRLESTFTYQPETSDSDTEDTGDTKDDSSSEIEDLNYMHLKSNVNVSSFVSVKLSGHSNYNIWKDQMLSLLESHCLLHTIQIRFPWDKDDPMTQKYGNLVRDWILSTMNEEQRRKYAMYDSVQLMWRNIESTFDETEDLKYMEASNVNVSDFVSVKLSGRNNYNIWKDQMVCLLQSHNLLHIIHMEGFRWDEDGPMTQKYGNLVRGWILSTMNDEECHKYRIYRSVKLMWSNIESTFGETEDLKYMEASNVNLSNFVLVNLSNNRNYNIWRAQMLYLLESHNLLHIITTTVIDRFLEIKYHKLVKGWILCTMNDKLLKEFPAEDYAYSIAKELWEKLESHFTKGYSRPEPVVSASTQDLKYTQALNVNVSNFVSVKLSGRSNYRIWKDQMLCLIESQRLLHIIDKEGGYEMGKYNTLVRGWIFSTMEDQLLNDFTYQKSARYIWLKLKSTFDPEEDDSDSKDETSPGFEFRRAEIVRVPEIEDTESIKIKNDLYEAAVEGCWWKAKSILKIHKNAATEAITAIGDTILHLAVENGHNYFLEKLLDFLGDGEVIEMKNDKGRTALHIAAAVGNTHAAQLLVQKRSQLLQILDCDKDSPFDIGYTNEKLNTYAYMLKSAITSDFDTHSIDDKEFAIMSAIITKEYDLAQSLLKEFPECARDDERILLLLTLTFPSDLGFTESFIYPSFNNVHEKTIARCSLLIHPNVFEKCVDDILRLVKICNNTCCSRPLGKISMILFVPIAALFPIYQLICFLILLLHLTFSILYFLMWKVLAITVHPIKNIEKKKQEYKEAKKILSLVCNQMGTSNRGYKDSLFEAVRQDTYEVVDEILLTSHATIDYKDEEGYNIIQLSIMNRAEKVYSLLYHIIERTKSYRQLEDSSENNLVHLAGKLAPSYVLERTTGAALQLQRELLWREEVKKLLLPIDLRDMNNNKETPAMVFTREHRDLMKEGENWIKTTAESCSITAALIVTIVFAAAITVPGGSNQESGIPVFKKETAFTVFAVSNAFSLFTASTALLLYLSILTARFSEKDFLISLPRRLIFGLLMLFLSTIAMMVAFGAILFLVFCDQRPWMLAPICVFTCLPISVIVTVKLPLLVDLIRSTYFPIFGNRSYLESCRTNRKNTIFTE